MKKSLYLVVLVFLILSGSCTKSKSRSWIVGEITVVDEESNKPVKARFELEYYERSLLGSEEKSLELGVTDDHGFFQFEEEMNRKNDGYKLNVFGGLGYCPYGYYMVARVVDLGKRSKNQITVELPRFYYAKTILHNQSCYDETDSVWIKWPLRDSLSKHAYAGCIENELLPSAYKLNTYSDKYVEFTTVSKKNNHWDTIVHGVTLTHLIENEIVLNY